MILAFGDCEIDRELYQLRRRGRVVKLEPKVFDVLAHLAEHRDHVVTKNELLDSLWPGEALSESVLPRAIAAARRAVGDTRAKARVIETVHGRGYRFVAEVQEGAAATGAQPAPPPPSAVFVGRERILARLERALEAALAGRGGIVLLAGEPGIGKTRTAEELARTARERGAQVLMGRCFEGEGAPAFWPWVQVLRELAATTPPARLRAALGPDAAALAQLAPELGAFRADSVAGGAGEEARFRLFDALSATLRRRAQQAPLVLVLDDLHWADEASLRCLEFLAQELRGAAILVAATFRDVEVRRDHPLSRLLGALARVPACERIPLRGLEAKEVGALVAAVLGVDPAPELARTVHEMTEGNPFFVFELARLVGESGDAEARPSALALPQSVRDAIGRRLDAVSPDCNELLRAAAVLGRAFDAAILARATSRAPDELLDLLGEALAAGVLAEGGGVGRFAFSHALVRQTLYEELRAPQRVRLHRRAAEALESAFAAGDDPPFAEIAHHWFEAAAGGGAEEAIAAAVRAAQRAHALLAYEESARLYEQALEALAIAAPEDAERRFELLASAAAEHAAAGARDSARARWRTAAGIGRAQARTDLLARAAIGHRGFGEMGTPADDDTLALLEEARDALGDAHPVLRSRLLSKLTGIAPYMLSMAKRDELSREALALARASGDPVALQDALSARYWACLGPDRVAERRMVGEEMIAIGERNRDPLLVFTGHEALFCVHLLCGDTAGADRSLAACVSLAERLRYRFVLFQARFFEGARAACAGDFAGAERILADALERGSGRVAYAQVIYDAHTLWLRLQHGDHSGLGASRALLERISGIWDGGGLVTRAALALIACMEGRSDDARRALDEIAAGGLASLERDEHFLLTTAVLSDVITELGDRARAAELYALLLPYADLLSFHDLLRTFAGSVSGELGELASLLGRHDAAVAHFEEALRRERAAGARAAVVSSGFGLARSLRRRGAPGDVQRADALVREAARDAEPLGIRWAERFGFDPETLRDLKE